MRVTILNRKWEENDILLYYIWFLFLCKAAQTNMVLSPMNPIFNKIMYSSVVYFTLFCGDLLLSYNSSPENISHLPFFIYILMYIKIFEFLCKQTIRGQFCICPLTPTFVVFSFHNFCNFLWLVSFILWKAKEKFGKNWKTERDEILEIKQKIEKQAIKQNRQWNNKMVRRKKIV